MSPAEKQGGGSLLGLLCPPFPETGYFNICPGQYLFLHIGEGMSFPSCRGRTIELAKERKRLYCARIFTLMDEGIEPRAVQKRNR